MARKSRKEKFITEACDEVIPVFNVALYIRLSREETEGDRNHDSFKNQKAYLLDYVSKHPEMKIYKIYEDNGYTGTNYDRPGFSDMMYDVSDEKINCIIVKDLSRLGRNSIETGKYIDYLFPMIGLRFIAINDDYDSFEQGKTNSITIPLKSIINEFYSKDISRKVISAKNTKIRNGEYVGGIAPYGYVIGDNRKFVIDNEAAANVRKAFDVYEEKRSLIGTCNELMRLGIDCPGTYKIKKGLIKQGERKNENLWLARTLRNILKNPAYVGHMAQGKSKSMYQQTGKMHYTTTKDDEWIIVKNTHPAIISEEQFNRVQAIMEDRKPKKNPGKACRNLLRGKIFCGECGHFMVKNANYSRKQKHEYYSCYIHTQYKEMCDMKAVRAEEIDKIVFQSVKTIIIAAMDNEMKYSNLKDGEQKRKRRMYYEGHLKRLSREIEKKKRDRFEIYEDFTKGIIDTEEFKYAKEKYSADILYKEQEREKLSKEYELFSKNTNFKTWLEKFKRFRSQKNLTEEMVDCFIDKVVVYDNKTIEIKWKFFNDSRNGEVKFEDAI